MFRPLPCVRVKKWGRGDGASVLSDLTPNPEFPFWACSTRCVVQEYSPRMQDRMDRADVHSIR